MQPLVKVNYYHLIRRRWTFVAVVTLVVLLVTLAVTLFQPFEYESEVKILVIQKSAVGIDAYSASKSAERIGNNLSEIIYSSSFFSKVLVAGFAIDKSYFPNDEDKRRKKWQESVAADVPSGTTILDVRVYHPVREQATTIAETISYVLERQAPEYIGIPDVELKVVDAPLTSKYPVKPNFLVNLLLGVIVGLFVSISILIINYSEAEEAQELFLAEERRAQKREHKLRREQEKHARQYGPKPLPSVAKRLKEEEETRDFRSAEKPIEKKEFKLPRLTDSFIHNEEAEAEIEEEEIEARATPVSAPAVKRDFPAFRGDDEIKTMFE
jgi:capsular polysaccharide biosynthesis protein